MNTALLLLEIQNDYFTDGRTPLEKSIEASTHAQKVLHYYRENNYPIIHVQHISTHPDASSLLPCTKGAEFHEHVRPLKNERIIKKHYPNSFKDTQLLNYLIKNKINHLVVCGMMTQQTIDATVRAAYDLGFTCTVLHDACAARQVEFNHTCVHSQQVHYSFLGALQPAYANVMSTQDFLQKVNFRSHSSEEALA